jgi:hypothetical protein
VPTSWGAALPLLAILAQPPAREPWSPEQALGPPDTHEADDAPTAWTPLEPDAGEEWLVVQFERPAAIAEVRVRESLNPGAVRRVSAVLEDGSSTRILWEGQDPTADAPSDFVVRVEGDVSARTLLVELDTARRPGWNAIDAVELVGRDGSRQWATEAAASSTYATAGGLLASELAPEARVFADEAVGIRMAAPGWWIRANPALLAAPGEILRAWTRDGAATIVVLRLETDRPWSPRDLLDVTAAALESAVGAEVQAREVHKTAGMRALGLIATGTHEDGKGRTKQRWEAIPRAADILVFLLSAPEASFAADDRIFGKMLASVEIGGTQTPEQRAAK